MQRTTALLRRSMLAAVSAAPVARKYFARASACKGGRGIFDVACRLLLILMRTCWSRGSQRNLEAFVRTISMIFCIKLTIVSRSLVELTFPTPPILKFSSPLLILMGEGHDFETSGLKGQRNTKAFETALININSSTALNRLSWGVCWDCHRIDAMETGSIRLVQKRPFARVRFRLRNCLGNHYCNPSENTFPPNCTPEFY